MSHKGSNSDTFTNKLPVQIEEKEERSNTEHAGDTERNASPIVPLLDKMAYEGNTNCHIDEIDKWVISLERLLEDVPQYMCTQGHPGRISRIPENLREADVKAYEPKFLSIGPYHHGRPRLQWMEMHKRMVLKCALKKRQDLAIKDYLKLIRSIEPAARSFYSDIHMDSEIFVQMLLLDSFYILTMFCGMVQSQERRNQKNTRAGSRSENEDASNWENILSEDDNESKEIMGLADESTDGMSGYEDVPRWFWIFFEHDIFLLENQLPFFVLEKMHELAYGGSKIEFVGIMKSKVSILLSVYTNLDPETVISRSQEIHHLLHLCHMLFCPTIEPDSCACQDTEASQMYRLGSAVQLYNAGVNFEAKSGSAQHCLLDVTFCDSGRMSMPYLQVDDNTISLLRNLIAIEQMKYPSLGLHVSAYAVLLVHLITVPEDVELLRRKGIIRHHLSSDKEMMYLVNRLSVGLIFDYVDDKYSLKPVFEELKRYSELRVPRWRAWLKHKYFSNPWTMISLLAASFLLITSALQTFYAVYSYYNPKFGHR